MENLHFNFENRLSENCKSIRSSFIREILEVGDIPGLISFAGGLPNPRLFPVEQMKQALDIVMANGARTTLQYANSQGYLPLREWICARYYKRFGITVSPENVIITNGSQQALDLAGRLFLNPFDTILLEKPSYIGAIQAFSAYNVKMEQVSLNTDGISIPGLKEAIKRSRPKFLYSIPNFQNPSGISYSPKIRNQLAQTIASENLILIEDDPYSEISFNGKAPAPVSFLIPGQSVLTGSFSKMISPGIRTGWIVANSYLKPYLLKAKQASDLHTNNLVQHLIYQFLIHNNVEEHLNRIRENYLLQKKSMLGELYKNFPKDTVTTDPDGGMFLWATLPGEYDTGDLIHYASKEKVLYVPGKTFFVNGDGNHSMRLNYTNSSPEEIVTGMKRLGLSIAKYRNDLNRDNKLKKSEVSNC